MLDSAIVARLPRRTSKLEDKALTDRSGVVTAFYDGTCPLCSAEIGIYRRCAGVEAVAFVDVSTHECETIVSGIGKEAALARFHVRDAEGTLVSGAEAFGHLWLALPGWRWIGGVVLMPGVLQVTEFVYRGFLVVRPALQWIFRATSSTRSRS